MNITSISSSELIEPSVPGKVLLLSMPFAQLFVPSLGLSLLKQCLLSAGFSTEIRYGSFAFAQRLGVELYSKIANGAPVYHDMFGEWVFSGTLFQQSAADAQSFLEQVVLGGHPAHAKSFARIEDIRCNLLNELQSARDHAGAFVEEYAQAVAAEQPSVVGFTSVFQQNVCSLATARRIKQLLPSAFIIFGGANCEGPMGQEMLRQFPFIDAVVSGEAEQVIVPLVECAIRGDSRSEIKGVSFQSCSTGRPVSLLPLSPPSTPMIQDLDALPVPDFSDYFDQLEVAALDLPLTPRILFETSRGCWWGEKSHCTFCGLNGATMKYRSKSAGRALAELKLLHSRHPLHPVSVVDNILDVRYFKDLIPALASEKIGVELFYEVKANLRKAQVQLLRDAGIRMIQPGIESLSDSVLKLMGKGVRGMQNIQLLKWCKELGVRAEWNLLWGFPGEDPAEYHRMAELVPLITHFQPPVAASRLRLDRFSPNHARSSELGFSHVVPFPTYGFIYDFDPAVIDNLAYYFDYAHADGTSPTDYTGPLASAIEDWQRCHCTSDMFAMDDGFTLLIWDFRPIARAVLTVLSGLSRLVYLECDLARTCDQIGAALQAAGSPGSPVEVETVLSGLMSKHLVMKGGDSFLSLAVLVGEYTPSTATLSRLRDWVHANSDQAALPEQLLVKSEACALA